jgi:hypothetical protein
MKIIALILIIIFGVELLWKFGYNFWYRIKVLKGKIIWPWRKKKQEAKIIDIGLGVCANKELLDNFLKTKEDEKTVN